MMRDCPKCGDAVPDGKLSLHYRGVHAPPLTFLNSTEAGGEP